MVAEVIWSMAKKACCASFSHTMQEAEELCQEMGLDNFQGSPPVTYFTNEAPTLRASQPPRTTH